MSELDLLNMPLSGRQLIEANAGTGKTYSITAIHLRLLLETGLDLEQLLVMTFTRAATAELKKRLRERLYQARLALAGEAVDDRFVAALVDRLTDRTGAIGKVERSLRAFDLAPVHTIHGFCQQMLSRFSFMAGWDPDRELIEREHDHVRLLVERAWSELVKDLSPEFAGYLRKGLGGLTEALRQASHRIIAQCERPWRRILAPEVDLPALRRLEQSLVGDTESLVSALGHRTADLGEVLEDPGLNRNTYNPSRIAKVREALDMLCQDPAQWPALLPELEHLGRERLERATRKGAAAPDHPQADLIDELVAAHARLMAGYELRRASIWHELLPWVMTERNALKQRLGLRTYNDLVVDLDRALGRPDGGRLTDAIRTLFPVVLVDEFQDTDLLQASILNRIGASDHGASASNLMVHVGDPKQALYAFRGADVHAYLRARSQADCVHTLSANWRSHPDLLAGVNALFDHEDPFLNDRIGLLPSTSGDPQRHPGIRMDDASLPPFEIVLASPEGTKEDVRTRCATVVCNEIATLLDHAAAGRAGQGSDELDAGDICVLVRSHEQAERMAAALQRAGLGCARTGRSTVWDTAEAEDLSVLLRAVAGCERTGLVAAALATRICGLDALALAEIEDQDAARDQWYTRFAGFRQTWSASGVSALLAAVLAAFDTTRRWLAGTGAERALTNLFHLQDLLAAREHETGRSMSGLIDWINRQRAGVEEAGEETLLRLENDDRLVQVMTVHKAKGLEFPVVYCPFLWDTQAQVERHVDVEFHDEAGDLVLDLGSADIDRHREQALTEAAAEELRLAYVAMTRASHRCVVVWCPHNDARHSPLRDLLHGQGEGGWRRGLDAYRQASAEVRLDDAEQVLNARGVVHRRLPVEVEAVRAVSGVDADTPGVSARRFRSRVAPSWQWVSYSSLVVKDGSQADHDHDALLRSPDVDDEEAVEAIFRLPGGSTVGLMFHEIFETLDSFSPRAEVLEGLVARQLARYGLDRQWHSVVCHQVRQCLETPLGIGDSSLRLADLEPSSTRAEMEFHLALEPGDLNGILASLRPDPDGWPGRLDAPGFLHGYIDLVFVSNGRYFLVDYKSNRLGPTLDHYAPEALAASVRDSAYDLQYHLYALALHRLLSQQQPGYDYDRHFGGVYYLYLRGMRADQGSRYGVHFARPDRAFVEGRVWRGNRP